MSTLFTVLFLASCVSVWYFIKKKPNKQYRNFSIVALVAFFLLVGLTAPKDEKKEVSKETKTSDSTHFSSSKVNTVDSSTASITTTENTTASSSVVDEAPVEESNSISAEDWVKDHTSEDLDVTIADFNALTDESLKSQLAEQVANSKTTMFDKRVKVSGVATEFVEGSNGYSNASFIIETPNGHRVRIAARGNGNDALDLGEAVDVTGVLGYPLSKTDEYLVREASVMMQID